MVPRAPGGRGGPLRTEQHRETKGNSAGMMPQARVAAPGALCLSDNRRMPLARLHDPIVAIATAPGRGAVGIVRVSGPDLKPLALALLGQVPAPRHALYGPFREADGALIDHGLALYFPAPHSYTGEDVLELQAHGGPVVLQLLLARCLSAGAALGWALRLAEPGEFTQRAFLNDKLDLAQAEAVADLIDASTEAAARSATRSLAGAFSQEIEALAERIVTLRMLVEATLDFPEEEIDFLEKADARGKLRAIQTAVDAVLGRARQGALLREGLRVVLAGQPNVGKSSLLNALAGAELAIVTPIAGTTRDKVSETIQIHGVPVHVVDTAGLTHLQLGQLHRSGADRDGTGAEVGFAAHPLAGAHGLVEQAIENRPDRAVLLTEPEHLLHLGEDLALTQHQRIQAGRHPHQVGHRLLVVEGEQVGRELTQLQAGVLTEKAADGGHPLLGMAQQRVDLQPVAGAEDRGLEHLLIGAQTLEGFLHALFGDAEPLPDLHRGRAMTQADDGNVHGLGVRTRDGNRLLRLGGGGGGSGTDVLSAGRCSWRRP